MAQLLWEKAKDFLQRAFSVIFIATIVVWFLQSFDLHLNMVTDSADSILAAIVRHVWYRLFRPLGHGRLADLYFPDQRIYGKRECGIHAGSVVWQEA